MAQERRLVHRQDQVHVHRHVGAQAGRAHLRGEAHAAEDLHGARVAALHLGQELRRVLALDERAAHARLAERDGERQSDRSGSDDEDLGIDGAHGAVIIISACGGSSRRSP